jgi:hypothetical protein
MKNKVLLAAPNSFYKNYCFEDWILNAKRFGCDIFIADNSPLNANKDLYKKHRINYTWINPHGKDSYQFICDSQNIIRDYFLAGDYTHLFFLETDLFPPRTILPLLESFSLPVVSAPYFIYKNRETLLMNQEIRFINDEALTRNYSLNESFGFTDGNLKQCFAVGFGCTLIERFVMEELPFRIHGESMTGEAHADSFFYADLQRCKIPSYLYTGIIIRHYNSSWADIKMQMKGASSA